MYPKDRADMAQWVRALVYIWRPVFSSWEPHVERQELLKGVLWPPHMVWHETSMHTHKSKSINVKNKHRYKKYALKKEKNWRKGKGRIEEKKRKERGGKRERKKREASQPGPCSALRVHPGECKAGPWKQQHPSPQHDLTEALTVNYVSKRSKAS